MSIPQLSFRLNISAICLSKQPYVAIFTKLSEYYWNGHGLYFLNFCECL